jgi:hypothetical protein
MKILILTDAEHRAIQDVIEKRIGDLREKLEDDNDDADVLGEVANEVVTLEQYRVMFATPLKDTCNELIEAYVSSQTPNITVGEYFESQATILNAIYRVRALESKAQE